MIYYFSKFSANNVTGFSSFFEPSLIITIQNFIIFKIIFYYCCININSRFFIVI